MAVEIKMPQLSDTMHSGKILSWSKKKGDTVKRGDILAEVETDKANLEIESFQEGTLLEILVPAGTAATVGEVIAVVGAAGESYSKGSSEAPSPKAAEVPAAETPNTASVTPQAVPTPQASSPASSYGTPTATSQQAATSQQGSTSPEQSDRIKASPLARKIAEQQNIDLSRVKGSGPEGRIIKKDLTEGTPSFTSTPASTVAANANMASAPTPTRDPGALPGRLLPLSKMRETIARRMVESVTQSPHFYVTASIDMDEVKKVREILKERKEYSGISINHFVIKAVAYALEREPRVNRAVREGMIYEPDSINVGIITAIDDGLLIPVIKDTNTLSLKDLVFEAKAAVDRARAGRPTSADLSGGTFSISNMGMFDVENFTAIINPGQGGVLAVSSMKQEAVVKGGQIVIGSRMKVTLSVDHRIIDGIMAGNFLKFFKEALETPALLLL